MAFPFYLPNLNRSFHCFQFHSKAEYYLQATSERIKNMEQNSTGRDYT